MIAKNQGINASIYEKDGVRMRIIKEHPIITILLIEMIIVLILTICGFRITYDPHMINDWTAVEAVGTWIGGLIIPFAVIWVQKCIDDSEKRTGASNAATIGEVKDLIHSSLHNDNEKTTGITDEHVYSTIKIHIIISSEDIARELGVNVSDIAEILKALYAEKKIYNVNGFGNLRKSVEGCKWKIV